MNIEESNLTFVFPKDIIVSKFDDGRFYRKSFGKMPGGKGVDIIADSGDMLQLIEIKNCKGHEQENRWRTSVDNSKVTSAPATLDVKDRDSLDIEVAKKVASTIACRGQKLRSLTQQESFLSFGTELVMSGSRFQKKRLWLFCFWKAILTIPDL